MAFIIENSERYVKVVKNLSADGVVATMIEYKDKNTRILENNSIFQNQGNRISGHRT